jgi:hypothetical protein
MLDGSTILCEKLSTSMPNFWSVWTPDRGTPQLFLIIKVSVTILLVGLCFHFARYPPLAFPGSTKW